MNEIFNPPLNSFVVPLKEEFLEEQAGKYLKKYILIFRHFYFNDSFFKDYYQWSKNYVGNIFW